MDDHGPPITSIGFIGVGVMGEPICRNLAQKSDLPVAATDVRPGPLARLSEFGVSGRPSVDDIAAETDLVFLSLPDGDQVAAVCEVLLRRARADQVIADTSTTPVSLTRKLARQFEANGQHYADAPVARTRAAAEAGALSVMVGCAPALFVVLQRFLRCFATDITHCGDVGSGQVVKIMNNMVLFNTVVALAEALTVGRGAGVDGDKLFSTLAKGSADSFALRNHGIKSLLPGEFPEQAFSAQYARKDLACALELAADLGIELQAAPLTDRILEQTVDAGYEANYFPALLNVIDKPCDK